MAKTGWPRLPDQGKPALAKGNAEISESLALGEKRHPGRVARPHIMQDELEMISFLSPANPLKMCPARYKLGTTKKGEIMLLVP